MEKDNLLPIEYKEVNILEENSIAYEDVIFLNDFNVFEKGEKVESLELDFSKGEIIAWNKDGTKSGKSQRVILMPLII